MARQINSAGLHLIASSEGLRLNAYQDVAGIWTIGYGHIGGVGPGMTITEDEALAFLREDLEDEALAFLREDLGQAEAAVDAATSSVATDDNQFAAMVSLCFNIGSGNFRTSSVLRLHRAGNPAAAADAFLLWDKAVSMGNSKRWKASGAGGSVKGSFISRRLHDAIICILDIGALGDPPLCRAGHSRIRSRGCAAGMARHLGTRTRLGGRRRQRAQQ
jgi:lysozyme